MAWFRRRRKVKADLIRARREREAAEQRLEHDTEHTIIPLREIRARNHIHEDISSLFQKRARGEAGET